MEQNSYCQKVIDKIMSHCQDRYDYPFVINKGYGLDFILPDCPGVKVREPHEYVVKLEIRTWRGITPVASHYYGTLKANAPELCMVGEMEKTFYVGGYVSDYWSKLKPSERKFINDGYEVDVCRTITKDDLIRQPERFMNYDVGSKTNAFYTINTLVHYAKEIARVRFPEYRFVINEL